MAQSLFEHLLEVEQIGSVTVGRFKQRTILGETAIEAIGDRLLQLAGEGGRRLFLLNFAGVESLTSSLLGKFAALHRTLGASGGRLAFCRVDPFLMQIFKVVQMPDLIPIYADEAQGTQALSADQSGDIQRDSSGEGSDRSANNKSG